MGGETAAEERGCRGQGPASAEPDTVDYKPRRDRGITLELSRASRCPFPAAVSPPGVGGLSLWPTSDFPPDSHGRSRIHDNHVDFLTSPLTTQIPATPRLPNLLKFPDHLLPIPPHRLSVGPSRFKAIGSRGSFGALGWRPDRPEPVDEHRDGRIDFRRMEIGSLVVGGGGRDDCRELIRNSDLSRPDVERTARLRASGARWCSGHHLSGRLDPEGADPITTDRRRGSSWPVFAAIAETRCRAPWRPISGRSTRRRS